MMRRIYKRGRVTSGFTSERDERIKMLVNLPWIFEQHLDDQDYKVFCRGTGGDVHLSRSEELI